MSIRNQLHRRNIANAKAVSQKEQPNVVLYAAALAGAVFATTIFGGDTDEAVPVNNSNILQENTYSITKDNISDAITTPAENFSGDGTLSEYGQQQLIGFIIEFYDAYERAVSAQNHIELGQYLSDTGKEDFMNNFDEWFVENKTILNAKVNATSGTVTYLENNAVKVEMFESIEITNKENDRQQKYQINLTWDTTFREENTQFKIDTRLLTGSIVAYDNNGDWVKY